MFADCSGLICPADFPWFSAITADDTARGVAQECSGVGICNYATGQCKCPVYASGMFVLEPKKKSMRFSLCAATRALLPLIFNLRALSFSAVYWFFFPYNLHFSLFLQVPLCISSLIFSPIIFSPQVTHAKDMNVSQQHLSINVQAMEHVWRWDMLLKNGVLLKILSHLFEKTRVPFTLIGNDKK
jgi:hypothetical protein